MIVYNKQLRQLDAILQRLYAKDLFTHLTEVYPQAITARGFSESQALRTLQEAQRFGIVSEDCVEDYCKLILHFPDFFADTKTLQLRNNILYNHEIPQERKIVLLEELIFPK